jgi:hypothetical protein
MKKIIYFFIFVFCISLVYAQPQMPTTQIYGSINAPDDSTIVFELDGTEVGNGVVQNGKYGYDPIIFLDPEVEIGDALDVFVDDVWVDTITLQEEGTVNIDITVPAAPPPEEEEEEPTPARKRGGLVIPAANYSAAFNNLPQTFDVRSGDRIFLTFDGAEHTIRVARLTYQSIELLISSTPSTLTLNVNDTGEVDLDDDGITDISILYQGVAGNKGVISIDKIAQPAPPVTQQPTPVPPPVVTQPPAPMPVFPPQLPAAEPAEEAPAERGFPWVIVIIIAITGILGGIGFVFYEMKRSHGALQQEKQQKTVEDQTLMRLQSYVRQTLEQGYTKEQIRQTLANEGWSPAIISRVLK